MIIKGGSCAGAGRVTVHLLRTDQNERAEVKELRGVAGADLRAALIDMTAFAAGTNCRKPLYHASINPRAFERMTEEQWAEAIDRLEAALGLTGQPRAVIEHVRNGRAHRHVVWSRIDLARGRAISDSHNYRKHEEVARELERLFGFERVQGAHAERAGRERPKRTPGHEEMQQGNRTSIDPRAAKAHITGLWNRTVTGREFVAAVTASGWIVARGDRRDFVVLDPRGGVHSLARRVDGATAKDIRARMADIDPASLPSVREARAILRASTADEQRRTARILKFPRAAARPPERGRTQRRAA